MGLSRALAGPRFSWRPHCRRPLSFASRRGQSVTSQMSGPYRKRQRGERGWFDPGKAGQDGCADGACLLRPSQGRRWPWGALARLFPSGRERFGRGAKGSGWPRPAAATPVVCGLSHQVIATSERAPALTKRLAVGAAIRCPAGGFAAVPPGGATFGCGWGMGDEGLVCGRCGRSYRFSEAMPWTVRRTFGRSAEGGSWPSGRGVVRAWMVRCGNRPRQADFHHARSLKTRTPATSRRGRSRIP